MARYLSDDKMNEYPLYASVIPELALDKCLDYGVPPELVDKVERGAQVEITVRGAPRKGYIFDLKSKPDFVPVIPITKVISESALISPDLFNLAVWMSSYYCCPLSQIVKMLLPPSVRKNDKPKEQKMVMRLKSKEELKEASIALRNKAAIQSEVLDVMLQVTKGIFLSELTEKVNGAAGAVQTLIKKRVSCHRNRQRRPIATGSCRVFQNREKGIERRAKFEPAPHLPKHREG